MNRMVKLNMNIQDIFVRTEKYRITGTKNKIAMKLLKFL